MSQHRHLSSGPTDSRSCQHTDLSVSDLYPSTYLIQLLGSARTWVCENSSLQMGSLSVHKKSTPVLINPTAGDQRDHPQQDKMYKAETGENSWERSLTL